MKSISMDYTSRNRIKSYGSMILLLGLILSIAFAPGSALAQEKFPSKTINLIVGFVAGGSTDSLARPLAAAAGKILGQPVVVINKPGGSSTIAMAALKNEKPDGYNIGIMPNGAIINQFIRKVPYDARKDFTPIMQYAEYQSGLVVRADSPWKTVKELAEYARANPGKIRYSSTGIASHPHLTMEQLGLAEKVKWIHIPFEGGSPAITALLGGHVEASSCTSEFKPHVEAGRLRLLAAYGERRMRAFPNHPTLMDLGYDINPHSIMGIVGPKGVHPEIVETLRQAFKKAMEDPDFLRVGQQLDMPAYYLGPQELEKHIHEMAREVSSIIQILGLRKE